MKNKKYLVKYPHLMIITIFILLLFVVTCGSEKANEPELNIQETENNIIQKALTQGHFQEEINETAGIGDTRRTNTFNYFKESVNSQFINRVRNNDQFYNHNKGQPTIQFYRELIKNKNATMINFANNEQEIRPINENELSRNVENISTENTLDRYFIGYAYLQIGMQMNELSRLSYYNSYLAFSTIYANEDDYEKLDDFDKKRDFFKFYATLLFLNKNYTLAIKMIIDVYLEEGDEGLSFKRTFRYDSADIKDMLVASYRVLIQNASAKEREDLNANLERIEEIYIY